ncbi:hypothetical protein DSO57_1007833 [Entomophthora muscae]|uniref:Uncharacterized protein n=1 Tax=Entomophthora muscae TaxID=34485 RepID=A0ACC2RYE1_9FUNG|nr:hypothetical protein DSO57_1007833 [Entomophthora muscae]
MTPPVTLQPNYLQETMIANESTSTKLFGILYIPLTGLFYSMVPTNGPWALLGKSFYFIVKLAPILWWALTSGPMGCLTASSPEPSAGWLPEKYYQTVKGQQVLKKVTVFYSHMHMLCVVKEPTALLHTIKKLKHEVIPNFTCETLIKLIKKTQEYKKVTVTVSASKKSAHRLYSKFLKTGNVILMDK